MSKPLPILSHMPFHIKLAIVESVDTMTKLSIRQCSKEFKNVVEKSKIVFVSLEFTARTIRDDYSCEQRYIQLVVWFEEYHVIDLEIASRTPEGFIMKHRQQRSEIVMNTGNFIDAAVDKFLVFLRIFPNVYVKHLVVNLRGSNERIRGYEAQNQQILDCLERGLMSLNRRVSAKELIIRTTTSEQQNMIRVLRFMKPRTLETITLGSCKSRYNMDVDLDKVAETIQWKQAKRLEVQHRYHSLPQKDTSQFEIVWWEERVFTAEMLNECLQNFLVHSHWKERRFDCDYLDVDQLWNSLSQYETKQISRYQRTCIMSESCKLKIQMDHNDLLTFVRICRKP